MIKYTRGMVKSKYVVDTVIIMVNERVNEYAEQIKDRTVGDFGSGRVEAYQNGREQGYTITLNFPKNYCGQNTISFHIAEHRNSDQMVVYYEINSGSMQGLNGMTDDEYRKQRYTSSSLDDIISCIMELIDDVVFADYAINS